MRSMKLALVAAAVSSIGFFAAGSHAATITPLTTFGGGDGWLAPGEGGYSYLGTGNNERGLAYGNGHLYLVSRTGGTFVRILDPVTGTDLGALSTTGVTGGTFALNTIGVGGDGVIYSNNLTTASNTTAFKVYSWATEASTPSVAYTGTGSLSGARIGDSFAVTGSGAGTRLAAGYSNSPTVAGNSGYAIVDPTAATATAVAFAGSPPAAGDFRLGLTFTDSTHVLGTQGISLGGTPAQYAYRYSSFSGGTGTLVSSPAIPDPAGASADRLLAYTTVGGVPILAVQSIGDSHVSVYDVTNPSAPIYLASGNNTVGLVGANANGNGTGQIAWGPSVGGIATLYAMSTNQGIQAFTFTLPEPASLAAMSLLGLVGLRRRK